MITRGRISAILGQIRAMGESSKRIYFGPYEVTEQVFHEASLCYALVNIKPILPGHVLVIPYRPVQRLTDLTEAEVTNIFTTVQKVQKMLARKYFRIDGKAHACPEDGSFNIAIQDGKESGQTVPHVHCHVIPRPRHDTLGDEIYQMLQGEEGNVGGGLHDVNRPKQLGQFPPHVDANRTPRTKEEMRREALIFKEEMSLD